MAECVVYITVTYLYLGFYCHKRNDVNVVNLIIIKISYLWNLDTWWSYRQCLEVETRMCRSCLVHFIKWIYIPKQFNNKFILKIQAMTMTNNCSVPETVLSGLYLLNLPNHHTALPSWFYCSVFRCGSWGSEKLNNSPTFPPMTLMLCTAANLGVALDKCGKTLWASIAWLKNEKAHLNMLMNIFKKVNDAQSYGGGSTENERVAWKGGGIFQNLPEIFTKIRY